MRRTALMSEQSLKELLAHLPGKTRLAAPVRRGKVSIDFDWIDDPSRIVFDYVRTVMPPKKVVWPTREAVLEFDLGGGQASPVTDTTPFVLFGIHACDLMGINQLDWSMGQRHGVSDPHYLARRNAATIVGMECMPDEYCFCTSVGSCETREGADLFLTPIESGYFVEVLTDKGDQLLKQAPQTREAGTGEASEARAFVEKKKYATTSKIKSEMAKLPDLLEPRYQTDIFQATAQRCYSCGTCTNVCPTCFCFDVDDEVDLLLQGGVRRRTYDSCQFQDFAVVAGGHNFRKERADRVRHRWFRKFVYLLREHGQPSCVGCGRCSKYCTAGISLVDVLNSVVEEARKEAVR